MKTLRRIIQWTSAIVCSLYMLLQFAMHLSPVQSWAGDMAENAIRGSWDWNISIGKVRLGLWNRIIIDDIRLRDKYGTQMLHVSRMAAKVDFVPLLNGSVCIDNGQIFGAQAVLYQREPDESPNFQFLIDTFKSDRPGKKPLDLRIGSLLLRRVSVKWDKNWKPRKGYSRLDPDHLWLSSIALTAHLHKLTPDSINLDIRRLDFKEQCGLMLKNFQAELKAGTSGMRLSMFDLQFTNSRISIPQLSVKWKAIPTSGEDMRLWLQRVSWQARCQLSMDTRDLKKLIPEIPDNIPAIDLQMEANGAQGDASVSRLNLTTADKCLRLSGTARLGGIYTASPTAGFTIESMDVSPDIAGLLPEKARTYITRAGHIGTDGNIFLSKEKIMADVCLKSALGKIRIHGLLADRNNIDATIHTDGFMLDRLFASDGVSFPIGKVAFKASAKGIIKDADGNPDLSVNIDAPLLTMLGYEYHGCHASGSYSPTRCLLEAEVRDINGDVDARLQYTNDASHHLWGSLGIHDLAASRLNLTSKYPDTRLNADAVIDVHGHSLDDIAGQIRIQDLQMQTYNRDSTIVGPMYAEISTYLQDDGRTLDIESQNIQLHTSGRFGFTTLPGTLHNICHRYLPGIIATSANGANDRLTFDLSICDTTLIRSLLDTDVRIPHKAHVTGAVNGALNIIDLNIHVPKIHFGKETLLNNNLLVSCKKGLLDASLTSHRKMKNSILPFHLRATAGNDRLRLQGGWNNDMTPVYSGNIDLSVTFPRSLNGKYGLNAWIAPTDLVIADTLWRIEPGTISHHSGITTVNNICIGQGNDRRLMINGRISPSDEDSLIVDLHRINLEYVMNLINFHDVDFSGEASGTVYAKTMGTSQRVDGSLNVDNWKFNNAPLGRMSAHLNWGDTPQQLTIEADMDDAHVGHRTHVDGYIRITGDKKTNGLDLRVNTKYFNLAFLNKFTQNILEDVQGRVSGYCRIYGPFKGIDLEGDMLINEARMALPMLGTGFYLANDSVRLRPGDISFDAIATDAHGKADRHTLAAERRVYDISHSATDIPNHSAHIDGHLYHNSFKNLRYSFDIQANNFLAYDFREFGDNPFYATVFASGNVNIDGRNGHLDVNVDVEPQAGTMFTYNVTTPDALTQAKFITFSQMHGQTTSGNAVTQSHAQAHEADGDMFLNFNLNMTPAARLRLLMDQKTGSTIDIGGSGRLTARYYNKGRFQMYGTYKIYDGIYNINVQDVINRNFKFQRDGAITFNGDPMQATLNLKAVYTVPNVSLDDLSTTSLGFSKTRVDCIMNLTGRPQQPNIGFDFELPNATDDERQMVRSIVSTEEERNMQAIYLLGLGRFYSYSANATSASKGSSAMNSLVSTTISSKINELLNSAVGSTKWNFGANLKTGDDGWKNMDVEGLLSGSLFNDRLLLSGNFGYREKYYTQRNFISDVDVQYLLTKSGSVALKAYNQANDRYFVQSALNTQGIGIQLKKDFNRFGEMFRKKDNGVSSGKVKLTKAEKKAQKEARRKAKAETKAAEREARKAKAKNRPKWNKQTVVRVIPLLTE